MGSESETERGADRSIVRCPGVRWGCRIAVRSKKTDLAWRSCVRKDSEQRGKIRPIWTRPGVTRRERAIGLSIAPCVAHWETTNLLEGKVQWCKWTPAASGKQCSLRTRLGVRARPGRAADRKDEREEPPDAPARSGIVLEGGSAAWGSAPRGRGTKLPAVASSRRKGASRGCSEVGGVQSVLLGSRGGEVERSRRGCSVSQPA